MPAKPKSATFHRYGLVIERSKDRTCFGEARETIPFAHIVKAHNESTGLTTVVFLSKMGKYYKLVTKLLNIEESEDSLDDSEVDGTDWAAKLNALAYPGPRRRRILVIINPFGGTGNAERRFNRFAKPVLLASGAELDIQLTTHSGHAQALAAGLDLQNIDALVCVSGDGVPHEVFNGLASRKDAETSIQIPLCQLPGGSGNAMCHSLNKYGADWAVAALAAVKGSAIEVDLMRISHGDKITYSFLSQSFGIVADSDLGTENWRWMGEIRFTLGVLLRVFGSKRYPARLAFKPLEAYEIRSRTDAHPLEAKYGNVNDPIPDDWIQEELPDLTSLYVGKMPYMSSDAIVFPHAAPDDGAMDMIKFDASIGPFRTLALFNQMSHGGHAGEVESQYRKVSAYRLEPLKNNYISVDGEKFPCETMQVEVIPRAAKLLSLEGDFSGRAI